MRARTVLIAIAALLGVAGAALAIFVATFDANRYKPQLVDLVRERTGRILAIEGDLAPGDRILVEGFLQTVTGIRKIG